LTIPGTIVHDGVSYDVIAVGNYAFEEDYLLRGNLTFSNNMTTLGASSFNSCSNLTGQINFVDSITSIGILAFTSIPFTGPLILPENPDFTSLGFATFEFCAFDTLIIPKNLTYVDVLCFANVPTCVAISCNYDILPNFTSGGGIMDIFAHWSSNGTVSNIGSLSSTDVCNYLKSISLPGG
jgi:hypothetical protein